MTAGVDRHELRQIIAGLSEGVILVEPDQTIAYANEAALAMHGAGSLDELGPTVDDYRQRFALRYRNNVTPNQYPIERVVAGEQFHDVVVEVRRTDRPEQDFVHSLRSLVATDRDGNPSCLALILKDVSDQFEAEERFEATFNANPAPAVITRLSDLRHVKVNTGFLEMTGFTRDAVIGRSVYEVDVLAEARNRDLGDRPPQRGRHHPADGGLPRPAGGREPVRHRGRPADRHGRRALHAVHLRRPRTAPEGRDGAAPERGALRQGVPPDSGADRARRAAGTSMSRASTRPSPGSSAWARTGSSAAAWPRPAFG